MKYKNTDYSKEHTACLNVTVVQGVYSINLAVTVVQGVYSIKKRKTFLTYCSTGRLFY